jgi:hypothetical protein
MELAWCEGHYKTFGVPQKKGNKHHMESNKRYKKAPCMLKTSKKKASQAWQGVWGIERGWQGVSTKKKKKKKHSLRKDSCEQ